MESDAPTVNYATTPLDDYMDEGSDPEDGGQPFDICGWKA